MALETVSPVAFLLGRVLFGGVLAFTGLNHFQQSDAMTGYAESKGLPFPRLAVLGSGALLIAGGIALVLGVLPILAAGALVAFFLVATPTMHDFWNVEDPQQRQSERNDFLKNAALAGGALVLLAIGGANWPLAPF
ncbi:DoxX family protein [Haloplanus sp. GCM10025708]|uniref:DoxX family protein n=1 Tax=Haloferacaceae TaxID=1644056 RepID=UPI0036209444